VVLLERLYPSPLLTVCPPAGPPPPGLPTFLLSQYNLCNHTNRPGTHSSLLRPSSSLWIMMPGLPGPAGLARLHPTPTAKSYVPPRAQIMAAPQGRAGPPFRVPSSAAVQRRTYMSERMYNRPGGAPAPGCRMLKFGMPGS
jgi:hypothetical protein